jgi:hypothetical protein
MAVRKESKGRKNIMFKAKRRIGPALYLAGVLAAGCSMWQTAFADDEFRAGLMLQVPFGSSQSGSWVHFDNTRIGAKIQYASIDDIVMQKEQTIKRVYLDDDLQRETVTSENIVTLDNGDKVSGAEAYFMVTPFNRRWNMSAGVNGFTGNRDFQGALGLGFDTSFGAYTQLGVLMPYSEAGLRYNFRAIDFYAGLNSLGGFSSKTQWKDDIITYDDVIFTSSPPESIDNGSTTTTAMGKIR